MQKISIEFGSGHWQQSYEQAMQRLLEGEFASQLAQKNSELWGEEGAAESAIRLGWLDFSSEADALIAAAAEHRALLNSRGVNRIVLCGMGGSSLAPEVISEYCNVDLTVLDSSHPEQVAGVIGSDLSHTAVVVSSKSGSTIETLSHLRSFEKAFTAAGLNPDERIIIITDPGSPLAVESEKQGRRVYLADPTVGGRFSALTAFGLVPPTLAAAELAPIVSDAAAVLPLLLTDSIDNPALRLAARLYAELPQKMFPIIIPSEPDLQGFGDWVEQLVAESTGKHGKGVLPISASLDCFETGDEIPPTVLRLFINELPQRLAASDVYMNAPLGKLFMLWFVATSALCYLLEVCPFDQPDVESAKAAAKEIMTVTGDTATASLKSLSDAPEIYLGQVSSEVAGVWR